MALILNAEPTMMLGHRLSVGSIVGQWNYRAGIEYTIAVVQLMLESTA
jgi:hypothetical protein